MSPMPDLARVKDEIRARGMRLGDPLHLEAETGSTNDDAKEGARAGAPHGATWVAECQGAGRGRQGRVWTSPPGENLLFSVLLRLTCPPARVPLLALAAGLAVRDVVAKDLGDDAAVLVKWPNDVLVRSPVDGELRKVAGILVESQVAGTKTSSVVVGIGLNVHTRAFPNELRTATSLAIERTLRGRDAAPERAPLLAALLAALDRDLEHVAHRGLGLVHGRLVKHDALAGRAVETDDGPGTAEGIDADGRLLVRGTDGVLRRINSGEVRVRVLSAGGTVGA